MNKPTQELIDAAKPEGVARIIFEHLSDIDGDEADWLFYREDLESAARAILAVLTAAAEVGERPFNFNEISKAIETATIERCAQVVNDHAAEIAAWSHQDAASRLAAMTEPTQAELTAWYRNNWWRMAIMAVLVMGLVLILWKELP